MTDETQRLLGELCADVRALRQVQERHEETTGEIRADVVQLRIDLAKIEQGGGNGIVKHVITVLVGALAGFGGGHTPMPGAH